MSHFEYRVRQCAENLVERGYRHNGTKTAKCEISEEEAKEMHVEAIEEALLSATLEQASVALMHLGIISKSEEK